MFRRRGSFWADVNGLLAASFPFPSADDTKTYAFPPSPAALMVDSINILCPIVGGWKRPTVYATFILVYP